MADSYRVGLIVPSSNTTMETEIPEMLQRRAQIEPESFTLLRARFSVRVQVRRFGPAEAGHYVRTPWAPLSTWAASSGDVGFR